MINTKKLGAVATAPSVSEIVSRMSTIIEPDDVTFRFYNEIAASITNQPLNTWELIYKWNFVSDYLLGTGRASRATLYACGDHYLEYVSAIYAEYPEFISAANADYKKQEG